MKSALILGKDPASTDHVARSIRSLGYLVVTVTTPEQALEVASSIAFDVVVTCLARRPNDRRSLVGELKRSAPEAAVILIAENDEVYSNAQAGHFREVSAVLKWTTAVVDLRKMVSLGIDGTGWCPLYPATAHERRRTLS